MATVVRVKRRCDEEPLEAFVLNCKRRKLNTTEDPLSSTDSTTLFKFAGTLEKDEDILPHLDSTKYAEETQKAKIDLLKHTVKINDKLRAAHKEASKKNRFKIVNRFRSQTEENSGSSETDCSKSVTVIDLEGDFEENSEDKPANNAKNYVYDLYYTQSNDFEGGEIEDYVSVHPIYEYLSMAADNKDCESGNESEDSNAENNWRNDYPDESDGDSINENDMIQAMENIDLDDDLLSSDNEENDFVYSVDDDVNPDKTDVERYGKRYAMFKAKYNKDIGNSDLDEDSSD
ncbi:hypothetical protein JTB14_022371 [Gonioctena quinquepunctata]|nr:hypothetical protein JTB14_022371 [Gonioctena quinquepunctata]